MKIFRCDHCRQLVYFENHRCLGCQHELAFLPDALLVASLDPAPEGWWTTPARSAAGRRYRLCANYTDHQVCNWAVPADSPHAYCPACRLTQTIPDLTVPGHREAWYKLEACKRRLIYSLLTLRLPIAPKADDAATGLAFEFLADPLDPIAPRILTGHADGLITLNLAEADDVERERRRLAFQEPYRTLLGHFRHESGHYYWDRLVRDQPVHLTAFREQFGDETADYAAALARHHGTGAPADWPERFISAYASAHPWEDWAETWAHYLHMMDALETAAAVGVHLKGPPAGRTQRADLFDRTTDDWLSLTHVLNNLNRGLGLPDAYPFILTPAVLAKLRCVHRIVAASTVVQPGSVGSRPATRPDPSPASVAAPQPVG